MGQDSGDITSDTSGADDAPAARDAREPRDAARGHSPGVDVRNHPPMPSAPPDAGDAPDQVGSAGPGTLILGQVEPRDASPGPGPGRAEPGEGEAAAGPGTLVMGRAEPQDAEPGCGVAPAGPGTLDMGRVGPSDAGPEDTPPGSGEPDPGGQESQDAIPGPLRAAAPASGEDESLGGDAPLVGLPMEPEGPGDDEGSLGGDVPLVAPARVEAPGAVPAGPSEASGGPVGWWPEQTGRLLAGRYRLGAAVGRGGMGTVWQARDEMLGRSVAVKELRLPSGVDDGERQRLITRTLREAKAIATIRSQGVVTVYDVVDEGNRPWIVMELIEGRSLADIIRFEGPMAPPRVAEIGLAILDVLRAAHGAGILHRDVKPSNVLIQDSDGRVVLTDFGIAKVEGDPSITSTGMLVGAPSYISPERARGEALGPSADMWSLGALLYCCVEGRPPYDEGGAIATLAAVMHDPVPPPAQAGELTEVITRLLDKEPSGRLDEPGARALLLAALGGAPAAPAAGGERPGVRGDSTTVVTPHRASPPPPAGSPAPVSPYAPSAGPSPSLPAPPTPPTPLPRTAGPGESGGRSRRRTLLIAAVAVVLLALLGTALAVTLSGDSGGDGEQERDRRQQGENEGQDGGSSGGPEQTPDETAGPTDDPAPDPTDDPADDGGPPAHTPDNDPGASLPESPSGFSELTDPDARFSMDLPSGWERTGTTGGGSGGVYSAPGGGPPSVRVDFNGSPADNALSAWREVEPALRQDGSDYDFISVAPVQWRDYPTTADWQFERTEDGERVRVLNRTVRIDGDQGYSIVITCAADAWDGSACHTLRETAFYTFQPVD